MRKFILASLILFAGFFITNIHAQTVSIVIEGHVTDIIGGAPIANQSVTIMSDSSSSMFVYYNTVITDNAGHYIDVVDIPAGMQIMFYMYTIDCNGTFHNAYGMSTNAPLVNDFIICNPATAPCDPMFMAMQQPGSNMTVNFTDMSNGNPVSWYWTFDDGGTSTQQNPTHTYNAPGLYIVCLTILCDTNNLPLTYCDSIYVSGGGPGCISGFTSIDSNLTVVFTGYTNSTYYTYYSWDFGDGNYGYGQNITHTYAQAGTYLVCLTTVDSNNCTTNSCDYIVLAGAATCNANFYSYPDSTVNFAFYFQDASSPISPDTWAWDFGDGTTSNLQYPYHIYNSAGAYNVCLTITTGNPGTSSFCQDTKCKTVYADTITSQCYNNFQYSVNNLTVDFYGSAYPVGSSYSWDFGDGNMGTGQNVTHTYALSGMYMVNLLTTNFLAGCTYTSTQWIYVGNAVNCNADFYIVPDSTNNMTFYFIDISSGAPQSWYWDFGDGNSSTLQYPTHTYAASGIYGVCLTIVCDSNGTTATHCDTLFVNTGPIGSIYGTISTGGGIADFAEVYLIEFDAFLNTLTAIDTVYTSNNPGMMGYYEFQNVAPGTYLVKAALMPGSASYAGYMPTYYTNSLWWDYATNVLVNNQWVTADINLIPGNNPGGPGFIGGNVTQGSNKAPGDAMPDIEILLLSMTNDPHLYTYTDINGDYGFSNLAYGTYKIWAEIIGKTTIPVIVTIDANNPSITDIDLIVNTGNVTTSVDDNISSFVENVSDIYPNPVSDEMSFEVSFTLPSELQLEVFNQIGQMVYSRTVEESAGQQIIKINTSDFDGGVYSLRITTEDNTQIMRKFVKIN